MYYTQALLRRQDELGRPVRVAQVGAGQMGSGLIAQLSRAKGIEVVAVADIAPDRAVGALERAGLPGAVLCEDVTEAIERIERGERVVLRDGRLLPQLPVDLVLEVSGVPDVAASVAWASITAKKHVALMTVEADVTVGLLLASMANAGNSVYTVCRGDEPVECLELVHYAEDLGLTVVAAGKGKNNPNRPYDTPDDVRAEAEGKGMNPKMLCEFTDGTKTQLEMCALSNATGYPVDVSGMHGPACDLDELATMLVPEGDGGILGQSPVVEFVTGNVAPGVFVVVKSESDVVTHELDYLKLGKGPYYVLYRPYHLASIEAHLSIGQAVLEGTASFQAATWTSEVVARAKIDLPAGTVLDGMGGYHARGWTVPVQEARERNALPMGLLAGAELVRDIAKDEVIGWDDVVLDESRPLVAMRRLQDSLLGQGML